VEFRLKNF